jgi:hypothetical protein
MTVKLTDAQLLMLSVAAQREDLCLTAPDNMKGAILTKVSEKLMKVGLVREVRAKAGMPVWRRDDSRQSYALKLTVAGLKAIVVDDGSGAPIAPGKESQRQRQPIADANKASNPDSIGERAKPITPRAGSKQALVIELLRRTNGATILDMTQATGWLAHTTRAALTGLRKRGYAVSRERIGAGGSGYRISDAPAHMVDRGVQERDAVNNGGFKQKATQAA